MREFILDPGGTPVIFNPLAITMIAPTLNGASVLVYVAHRTDPYALTDMTYAAFKDWLISYGWGGYDASSIDGDEEEEGEEDTATAGDTTSGGFTSPFAQMNPSPEDKALDPKRTTSGYTDPSKNPAPPTSKPDTTSAGASSSKDSKR